MRTETIRRTTKTKAQSTAFEVLEELALTHELPRLILEWRGLQKLKGTYIDALPALVHPATGRVHTCFNQAVAATGRLSSSDPNLQNIPIRTDIGREIRRAFVAEPRHVLISADYSQIELRVLAHLSKEQTLVDAFREGEDIHDRTALQDLWHDERSRRSRVAAARQDRELRPALRQAGVHAGEGHRRHAAGGAGIHRCLLRRLSGSPRLHRQPARRGARRRAWSRRCSAAGGSCRTSTRRNFQMRGEAERKAVNFPIQGTAADILKRAMIDVHKALPTIAGGRARMILTVHDELLFETPKEAAEETAALVRELMEKAVTLDVPLEVDVGIGENWKEAK